jgi:hypothetical protein
MNTNYSNDPNEHSEEEIQNLVFRYCVGELTDVQFNFYVQTWNLDREYVNLLIQDYNRGQELMSQAGLGCIVLVFFLAIVFVMYLIMGIA